jgi:hypothetical protein
MAMKNPLKKQMTPVQKSAMADVKARGLETKSLRKDSKAAKKAVKKAGANTPAYKAIMKGKVK